MKAIEKRKTMDKIAFLKILIGIITSLIFLTLGGIVYGLVNYKTTPKLLSRKKAPVTQQQTLPVKSIETERVSETYLGLKKGETVKNTHACGDMLCLHIKSDFESDKIIIFDPAALRIKAILIAGQSPVKKQTEK